MHFPFVLPDWNALDSVRSAHSQLEGWALIFFALLVVFDIVAHLSKGQRATRLERWGLSFFLLAVLCEVAAYPYGQRNDILSAQQIGSLAALASKAKCNASTALADSKSSADLSKVANDRAVLARDAAASARKEADSFEEDIVAAKEQAANAETHLADALERAASAQAAANAVKGELADRWLTDDQVRAIVTKVNKYTYQQFEVTPYSDSPESVKIAKRVLLALYSAGWTFVPATTWRALMGGVVGITVNVHPKADETTQHAADDLVSAISHEGLDCKKVFESPSNPVTNMLNLNVGAKR